MLIRELRVGPGDEGSVRATARLSWETDDREAVDLWFESTHPLATPDDDLMEAFLVAAAPVAMLHGERRVAFSEPLSRDAAERVGRVLARIASVAELTPPVIEGPVHGTHTQRPPAKGREMAFFSGGVDSLAMVRERVLATPGRRFTSGLLLFGLNTNDFTDGSVNAARLEAHEEHARRLLPLARECGLDLVRMTTNVRSLYPDFDSWAGVGSASGLAAAALISTEWDEGWLASDGLLVAHSSFVRRLVCQLSCFPLLSSDRVQLHVGQPSTRRLDKVRLLSGWPAAMAVMRPCLNIHLPERGRINCGSCEKCLRTMLALVALGSLSRAAAFDADDVTAGQLRNLDLASGRIAGFVEVIEPLRAAGRNDLAAALESAISAAAPDRPLSMLHRLRAYVNRVTGGR